MVLRYCDYAEIRSGSAAAQLMAYLEIAIRDNARTLDVVSITINGGYACKRHRDGNSVGPSIITAFWDRRGRATTVVAC